jgi:purine-binding chemotaxis protein CheW
MRTRRTAPIDWAQIRQRLARVDEALARDHQPSADQRRSILEARARAVAQSPPAAIAAGEGLDVVEFELAQVHYAVDAAFVREVQALKGLTDLPCTPPFVSGIINVHGRIIAVIDLKSLLELPESGTSDLNKVIILQRGEVEFGILAERIIGAQRVPLSQLQASQAGPPVIGARLSRCLRGVAPGRLLVLDAQRLMSEPALLVDEEVSP